jgi:hypothetical protein
MWGASSRESPEPKLALKDLFYSKFGLTKVLRNNSWIYQRKLFEEIAERLPQNVRGTTGSDLVLAGKIALRETAASLFDLRS